MSLDDLVTKAEAALAAAGTSDRVARHGQMTHFMDAVEQMAERIAAGDGSWDDLAGFGARTAAAFVAAREELERWHRVMWNGAYSGGEEDALTSLQRRTQEELARGLYRGTEAEPLLAELYDEETDAQLHDRAETNALDAPDYVPRSHTWWRWLPPAPERPPAPPAAPTPAPAVHVRAPEPAWIAIAAGALRRGLTGEQAHRLAVTCADGTLRWAHADPDASMRDVADAEAYGGNAAYLEPLIRAAFPARVVELPAFEIRATPVTHAEYARFVAATRARPATARGGADHPVVGVSWDDATAFAAWAGAALPTEDQWERAARGPSGALFPWGDELGDRRTWLLAQDFYAGWPVGTHGELATPEGVHDLVTERWEWVADAFAADPAALAALRTLYPGLDPAGRVRKGGRGAHLTACAVARTGADPTWQADGTGFRLVRAR